MQWNILHKFNSRLTDNRKHSDLNNKWKWITLINNINQTESNKNKKQINLPYTSGQLHFINYNGLEAWAPAGGKPIRFLKKSKFKKNEFY
jgi:hypothetical protein